MNRERAFFLVLVGVSAALSAVLLAPYLQYVLAAVLLAYVLRPLQRRLAPRIGARAAAASLMLLSVVVVLVPVAVVARIALRDARSVVGVVRDALRGDFPEPFDAFAGIEFAGVELDVAGLLASAGGGVDFAGGVIGVVGGVSNAIVGVAVLLFALYYLLVDGDSLVRWLRRATPLSPAVQDELYARIDRLTWAVLVGNVLVAVVQGSLTGVGLWAAGVPDALFWAVMTTVLSLLPLIGASVVWAPASAYLLLVGDTVSGVALFVYGTAVVSLSDNYLRPIIGGREARLNPGLFIVGIFGGIAAMGVMGLFYGPIALGASKAVVELYVREHLPERRRTGSPVRSAEPTDSADGVGPQAVEDDPAESGS